MTKKIENRIRINQQIRASELRVVGPDGINLGVIKLEEALQKARELGTDLIEVSPNAVPPIAKIMDYGKFQYEQNKNKRKQNQKHTEQKRNQYK